MSEIMHVPADPVTLRDLLEKARPSIMRVLPKHLNADRLIKIALVSVSKTPKLQQCTAGSVLASVMAAAELGLDCGGNLGSAYLVPYGTECTLIIGYRGLIDLARRSGEVESIEARAVYKGDEFEYEEGLNPVLRHKPKLDRIADPAELVGVYFIAKMFGSPRPIIDYMSKGEVDAIRNAAKAKYGPWVEHYVEMAKKTMIRRGCKQLPLSPEKAHNFAAAEQFEDTDMSKIIDPVVLPKPPKPVDSTTALAARIEELRNMANKEHELDEQPIRETVDVVGTIAPELIVDSGEPLFDPEREADPMPDSIEDRFAQIVDEVSTKYKIPMDLAEEVSKMWFDTEGIAMSSIADGRSYPRIHREILAADLKPHIEARIPF